MKLVIRRRNYASRSSLFPFEESTDVIGRYSIYDMDPDKKFELGKLAVFLTIPTSLYEDKKALEEYENKEVMAEAEYQFTKAYKKGRFAFWVTDVIGKIL